MHTTDRTDLNQTLVLLEIVKALAVCEHATNDDLDGAWRVARLVEAHGMLAASCGPGHRIPFEELLHRCTGEGPMSLDGLLPDWIDTATLAGVDLMDSGVATGEGFDYRHEAQRVVRAAEKIGAVTGRVTTPRLDDEYNQESLFSAIKGPYYQRHRTTLVENPTVATTELAALHLPSKVSGFYQPIAQYARFEGWWWPCPACRWPMKVTARKTRRATTASVKCLYPWHAETGASYEFVVGAGSDAPTLHPAFECRVPTGRTAPMWTGALPVIPQAQRVEKHSALVRAVWRYTVVPGLPEVRLHQVIAGALVGSGWESKLWPNGDQCDHWIVAGEDAQQSLFAADFKDYTHTNQLVMKLHWDQGDKGGAQYLVVPDHREDQVAQLDMVCRRYAMKAAMTATDYIEMVVAEVEGGRA
jgi:hypothetical protein